MNITSFTFTDSYIDKLIDYIDENYVKKGKDLARLGIVFGGKRPALFVKRALARRLKKDFVPPIFFTIDEFVQYTVEKKERFSKGSDLDECYRLYKLAKDKTPQLLKSRPTFAQFLPWAREVLGFIEQLDLECIENDSLKNIKANAKIGYDVPKEINYLLGQMTVLREAFHAELLAERRYVRGLVYLRASQVVKDVSFDEFDEILFCNFFYFHKSEENIVKHLVDTNKATLIFQGDERKWPVLERIGKRLNTTIREGKEVDQTNFDLKLYRGFDAHSQVGIVRDILKSIKNLERTVIVLPSSKHLMPLLSEVTQISEDFNISMGYPLCRSSLYTLFEFMAKAQISRKEERYYAKDYLKVLRHPFIKNLNIKDDPAVTRTLVHKIEEILTGKEKSALTGALFLNIEELEADNDLYLITQEALKLLGITASRAELEEILKTIHERFFYSFGRIKTFKDFAAAMTDALQILLHQSPLHKYPFNLNIVERMFAIADEIARATFKHERFSFEEMFKVIDNRLSSEMVNFIGSPLKGLQILGLFETRSLNFENVIVLDANEGVLPSLKIYEPLIPREVMVSLNLDRLELEEEIQRYQFMRLISSAKNVHVVYQESKEKERSRFVEELVWEKEKEQKKIGVVKAERATFLTKPTMIERRVKKTPAMIELLRNHVYSASSVNTYVRNPMEFYYKYVCGLEEKEDLLDEPEAKNVGTFIHELLEHSFYPFLNKKPEITGVFEKRFWDAFEEKFEQVFGPNLGSESFLLKAVLKERLSRFIENEKDNEARRVNKILYLENSFEDTVSLSCGPIRFRYIVDRVDELADGTVMIIDYKTGSVDVMPKPVERIEGLPLSRETIRDNVKSFQIPLYFHYLDKNFKDKPINAALYNLRTLKISKFIEEGAADRKKVNNVYLRSLDFVLSEILDVDEDIVEDRSDA